MIKGHSAHPGTSEIVARAMSVAIDAFGMPAGVFSLVQGGNRDVGKALVTNPLIRAVGFTGSLGGGGALFDLCAQRAEPIQFFGELGWVNPMFLLPEALSARVPQIAIGWDGSLMMGAGRFCTKPGIVIVLEGADAVVFANAVKCALANLEGQTVLTDGIAAAYLQSVARVASGQGVIEIVGAANVARHASPYIFSVSGAEWLKNETLHEEVFGPLGIIVKARNLAQMMQIADALSGKLPALWTWKRPMGIPHVGWCQFLSVRPGGWLRMDFQRVSKSVKLWCTAVRTRLQRILGLRRWGPCRLDAGFALSAIKACLTAFCQMTVSRDQIFS